MFLALIWNKPDRKERIPLKGRIRLFGLRSHSIVVFVNENNRGATIQIDSIIDSFAFVLLLCVFALPIGFVLAADSNGTENFQSSET